MKCHWKEGTWCCIPEPVTEPLQTGIKSIDAMIPVGRGQRELVIGDRQTGKTTVCIDTILNQKEFYDAGEPVYCIYVVVGQKASTVANIAKTLEDRGALPTYKWCYASDPAPMQVYAPFAGAAIGEYLEILVVQHLSFMMIYQSKQLPIVRYHFCFVVHQDVRPTQEMYFTYTTFVRAFCKSYQ